MEIIYKIRQINRKFPLKASFEQAVQSKLGRTLGKPKKRKLGFVKSPLRYPGGKSRAVKQILDLLPPNLDTLCSPFLGGGSIELACASKGVKVYAYDIFEPLVNFWQVLLRSQDKLALKVREYHNKLTKAVFYSLQKRYETIRDKIDKAAVYFVLNRSSFSGTTLSGGMSPGHPRFSMSSIERLEKFKIENFTVKNCDFKKSLANHQADFLYLDPPYLNGQKLYGKKGCCHDNFEHESLFQILKSRDGWILSYNDCEIIRDLYSGYKFLQPEWSYGMSANKSSKEVLILSKDFISL